MKPPHTPNTFLLLFLLAFLGSSPAHAQTYYYTGRNPATPEVNDATSAIACDADAIGAIRYNTGTGAFEGCNGVAWADIRNGAIATPAGPSGSVQFNSGGVLGGSANFTWDNVNGRLGVGTTSPLSNLYVVTGTLASNTVLPGGNWAGQIINQNNFSGYGGLLVANSYAVNDTQIFSVGNMCDSCGQSGFDTFFTVNGAGYVGLKTTSPAVPLDMSGWGTLTGRMIDLYNVSTSWRTIGLDMSGNGYEFSLGFPTGTSNQGRLSFGTYNGTTYSEKMAVKANGNVGVGTPTPGTALDVNGGVTMEPTAVTLTANNTVLATANRSYFRVTSDNTTETNRIFCFGAGTLGQVLIIEWTSSTNRGEIVSHGNCGGAVGAVTASLSYTNWAPKNTETILQLMYNGTHWIQIAASANY